MRTKKLQVSVRRDRSLWKYILGIALMLLFLFPIFVIIVMAFKKPTDFESRIIPPNYLYLGNFQEAFEGGKFLRALFNTIVIAGGTVIVEVICGCMAAYALARNRSRFNKFIEAFSLGIMMIPALSILVGVYTEIVAIGGINQKWSVILIAASFGLPMSIHLYTNFIRAIPRALDEAAALDGAGILRTFWSVILPQLKPVTVSVIILKGVTAWNEYLFPSYILQKPDQYTLVLMMKQYFGAGESAQNLHGAAAIAVMCVLPLILVYLLLQKYFIQGQIDSSVK